MKKRKNYLIILGTVSFILFLCCNGGVRKVFAEGTNERVLAAKDCVVRIWAVWGTAQNPYQAAKGSGFAVGNQGEEVQYFVTNDHCVSGKQGDMPPDEIYIIFDSLDEPDTVVRANIVYKTDQVGQDLAVLELPKPVSLRQPAVLGSAYDVRETDSVYAMGFPGVTDDFTGNDRLNSSGKYCTVKTGHVTRAEGGEYRGSSFIVFEGQINPGNSGGPLVNENGEVVGVNAIGALDGASDNGAIYVDHVKEILNELQIPYGQSKESKKSNAGTGTKDAETETEKEKGDDTVVVQEEDSNGNFPWGVVLRVMIPIGLVLVGILLVLWVLKRLFRKKTTPVISSVDPDIFDNPESTSESESLFRDDDMKYM